MEEQIVNTNIYYNSTYLTQNIQALNRRYTFLNIQKIGNSVLGTPIYCIKLR